MSPTPKNASELEEMLNERDGRLGDVMKAYVAEQTELIRAQLREEQQVTVAEMLQGKPAGGTGAFTPAAALSAGLPEAMTADAAYARRANAELPMAKVIARNKLFNKAALGAPLDGEPFAKSIGTFLQAIWHRAEQSRPAEEVELIRNYRKQMSNALLERVPSEGGFLIPEVLRSQILMVALENAVVRPRARIVPMDSLRVPYPTIDDTSHTSSVFGGVVGFWTEEAAALTQSQPSFGRIVLEAKKLTGYTQIPNELLQDASTALDQWFNEMFPIALAWFEDVAFIAGSGVGQPQGFQNSPCAVVTGGNAGNRAGGSGTAVQYSDLAAMYARLLPMSLNSAVWLASPDVLPGLLTMVTASGIAPPLWLPNFSAADGFPGGGNGDGYNYRIMGRPLVISEKMPALASQGCLALVDFNYYLLGDRMSMQVSSSEHYQFANDLTVFRVIERLDGRTWIQSAITPENGGNTLSPVVLLHS